MSLTTEIRSYADTAIEQAQQQFADFTESITDLTDTVTGNANDFVGKVAGSAKDNVASLTGKAQGFRTQAEKTLNVGALKSAVEPYLAQARSQVNAYRETVTAPIESLYGTVKSDPRVAKVVTTAEGAVATVVDTVNERLVKPAKSFTGLGKADATTKSSTKSSASRRKPAATRPARKTPAKATAAKKTTSTRSSATKTAGTRGTSKTTAAKTTAKRAAKKTPAKNTAAK